MNMTFTKASIAIGCALMTASCATGPDGRPKASVNQRKTRSQVTIHAPHNARNIGILGGAILGAVIAKKTGNSKGSVAMGAGLGALLGGFIGADMDRRRCELAQVAKLHNLDIVMSDIKVASIDAGRPPTPPQPVYGPARPAPQPAAPDQKPQTVGMSFTIFDHGDQFSTGSAAPSLNAQQAFADVAGKYAAIAKVAIQIRCRTARERNRKMRILLIGHTDDTGSSRLNADLSEERAKAVARIFAQRGFDPAQFITRAPARSTRSRTTTPMRAAHVNRRVEIVDLSDDATFQAFLASRRPNVANYRAVADENLAAQSSAQPVAKPQRQPRDPLRCRPPVQLPASHRLQQSRQEHPGSRRPMSMRARRHPASRPHRSTRTTTALVLDGFDFGGKPIDGQLQSVNIGKPLHTSHFSLISTAYAADDVMPIGNCAKDRPRISNRVKSLSSGQEVKTADYMPGAAKTSWGGKANGHMVGLADVAVLRDGGQPSSRPTLFVWKNWVDGSKARPDLKTSADANTYLGDQAMLYRVFPDSGSVRCIDVRIPNGTPNTAPSSTIVYQRVNALYQAEYSPSIAR